MLQNMYLDLQYIQNESFKLISSFQKYLNDVDSGINTPEGQTLYQDYLNDVKKEILNLQATVSILNEKLGIDKYSEELLNQR